MKNAYVELGINASGEVLVVAPVVKGRQFSPTFIKLSDLETRGLAESTNMIGQMLITALGAFQPDVKGYRLLPAPPSTPPFPTRPPLGEPVGEIRGLRMGLGFTHEVIEPLLTVQAYEGQQPLGEPSLQLLSDLADLGTCEAPARIGASLLRKLATMHPDVATLQAI